MKTENFEKIKRENKRITKEEKVELFDFESFKVSIKKWLIRFFWLGIILVILFGIFKIVKWGKVFDQNYIEYTNKKEDIMLPLMIGEKKLNLEDMENIKDFENKLNKVKLKVKSVETSTSSNTFIYNVTSLNNNFSIKINFDRKIEDTWNSFISVYFSKDISEVEKSKLEYIDVRYTSKVFYKLKSNLNELNKKASSTQ